ncbi:MAG TPA: type III pantothenate kinase [Oscillospiraceae bacterium]|mgnify:CR=1 FL=1|nr:type III pantothenate kinase [Oscillospiraceae bacterium]HPS35192.1 type III pantothenate kinase [Oscillospiraceae bacterium]
MLLMFDIGNSNITIGAYEGDNLLFVSRLQTDTRRMTDQYFAEIREILKLHEVTLQADGAVISSVVPQLTSVFADGIRKYHGVEPMVIGAGLKTGLDIKIENPAQMGADMVASAVGALTEFKPPIIIFDLGTATKATVVLSGNRFIGGMIAPGVQISLDALSSRTAQLPHIDLKKPKKVIGDNTIDCMRSGMIFGTAAMMDGMIDRMEEELGQKCTVVVTGGLSDTISGCCRHALSLRPNLILQGLLTIYNINTLSKNRT